MGQHETCGNRPPVGVAVPLQVDPETYPRDDLVSPKTNSKASEESPQAANDAADEDPVQTKPQGRAVDSVGSEGEGSENPSCLPSQIHRRDRDDGQPSLEHGSVQDMPAGHVGELGPNDSEPLSGDVEAVRTNPNSGQYEGPRLPKLVPVSVPRTTIPAVRLAAATSIHQAPNIILTQPSQPAMRPQPYLPVRNASEADLADLTRHDSVARSTRSRQSSKSSKPNRRPSTVASSSLGLIQMQPLADIEADRPQPQQRPASVPFPKRPLSQTSQRPRRSSANVDFSSLRRPPMLPPSTDFRGSRFSSPHTPSNTQSPRRHHFSSFITDESSVEIPRFKKRDLNLGIVRKSGMWESAAWVTLWVLSVVNALVGAFFDLNIMYLLAQCAAYPSGGTSSGGLWVFLAVAYSLAWAVSVLVVWLGWEVGFEFWRRWSVRRPAIEPIYFSLPASLNLALWSFSHFSFLLHTRLSPLGTRHALDIIPETAHLLVQLYHGLIPLLARASVAVIVLISFWNPTSSSRRDPHFFHADGQLSAYSKGLLIAFSTLVGIRLVVVVTSGVVLWLFSSHPLFGAFSTNAKASPELPRKLVLPQVRDPAHSQMPAKTWRDENELQWAWRDRARARIQDAFELCIVRPSRSRLVSWELDEKRVSHQLGLANLSLDMTTPRPLPTKIEKRHGDERERQPDSVKPAVAVNTQLSPRDTFTFSDALETGMCDTGLSPRSAVFDDIREVVNRCHTNAPQPPVYGEFSAQSRSYRNSSDAESAMTMVVPQPWARSTYQRAYSNEPPDSATLTVSTATSPPLITPTLDHPPARPYYNYGGYSDLDEREPTGLVEPYVFTAITSHRIGGGSHDTLPEGLYSSSLESEEAVNPKQTKDGLDPDDISPEDVLYPRLRPDASFADAVFGCASDDVLFGGSHGSSLFGGASLASLPSKRGSKSSTASSKRSRKSSRRSSAASEGKSSTSSNKFASPSPPRRSRSPPPPLPPLCSSWSAPASRNTSFIGIVPEPPRTPPIVRSVIPTSVPVTPPNLTVPSPQRASGRSPRTPIRASTTGAAPDSSTSSMTLSQARSTMTVSTINEAELFFSPPASPSPARTLQYHTPSRGGAHHVPGMVATPQSPSAWSGGAQPNPSMVITPDSPPSPSIPHTSTSTSTHTNTHTRTSSNTSITTNAPNHTITTVGLRTSLIPLPPEFGVMLGSDSSPEPRLRTLSQQNAALLPALVPLSPQLEQAEIEYREQELLSQAALFDPPLYPEPLPAPPEPNLRAHVRRRSRSMSELVRQE